MANRDLNEPLRMACRLAQEAGRIILDRWGKAALQRKADGSEVTDADWAAEEHIRQALARAYPDHGVLAEETGLGPKPPRQPRYLWAVDPLDGTQNYTRGFPGFATSIALLDAGVPVVSVVRDHVAGRTYTAVTAAGAYVDGVPMRAASRRLDYDFFVGVSSSKHPKSRAALQRLLRQVSLRSVGSTALHLALVASGALDAALSHRCYTWDIASGYLLVREAGGVCTDPAGRDLLPLPPQPDPTVRTPFVAAGAQVHAELLKVAGDRTPNT